MTTVEQRLETIEKQLDETIKTMLVGFSKVEAEAEKRHYITRNHINI